MRAVVRKPGLVRRGRRRPRAHASGATRTAWRAPPPPPPGMRPETGRSPSLPPGWRLRTCWYSAAGAACPLEGRRSTWGGGRAVAWAGASSGRPTPAPGSGLHSAPIKRPARVPPTLRCTGRPASAWGRSGVAAGRPWRPRCPAFASGAGWVRRWRRHDGVTAARVPPGAARTCCSLATLAGVDMVATVAVPVALRVRPAALAGRPRVRGARSRQAR